jgi:REP element-mobilizing transposase RayT
MDEYESLSRSKWECKYHVIFIPTLIFIPKCRRKTLYGASAALRRSAPTVDGAETEPDEEGI